MQQEGQSPIAIISSSGDVGFRQVVRLENCRSRCRYALSLNNRQNNSCQNKQHTTRFRCLRSSDATSARFFSVGSVPGVIHTGCGGGNRLLAVIKDQRAGVIGIPSVGDRGVNEKRRLSL